MPNDLVFFGERGVFGSESVLVGVVRSAPYERLRVLAYCPYYAEGSVELSLTHAEGGGAPGPLDQVTLIPGSQINQVYEVPGVVLVVSAAGSEDAPANITVWMWGYRTDPGAPPSVATTTNAEQLTIRVALDDGAGGAGPAAGAGVVVSINRDDRGVTNNLGELTASIIPGSYLVMASAPSGERGAARAVVEPGGGGEVTVIIS